MLYENYSAILYGSIIRIVKDTKAADKLLEKTFDKICKSISQYKQEHLTFVSWMLQFARCTSIDYLYIENTKENQANNSNTGFSPQGSIELMMLLANEQAVENEVFSRVLCGNKVGDIALQMNTKVEKIQSCLRKGIKQRNKS